MRGWRRTRTGATVRAGRQQGPRATPVEEDRAPGGTPADAATDGPGDGPVGTERDEPASARVEVARTTGGRPLVVPAALVLATAWTWRLVALAVGAWLLLFVVLPATATVSTPLLLALVLTALLLPVHRLLRRARVPRLLAAVGTVLLLLGALVGMVVLVGRSLATGVTDVLDQAGLGLDTLLDDVSGVVGIPVDDLSDYLEQARAGIDLSGGRVLDETLAAGSAVTTLGTGALLLLFATVFLLADGHRVWGVLLRLVPSEGRRAADRAGTRAWGTVSSYVQVLPIIALADAVGIGIGAALLGVPLAFSIGVLTFVTAFVPIVGAIAAGAVAVLVALLAQGPVTALAMLAVVLVVQQVESNVLQPLLVGRALDLHPLAVVLAATTGIVLAGIVGGVLAVPVLAATLAAVHSLREGHPDARAG